MHLLNPTLALEIAHHHRSELESAAHRRRLVRVGGLLGRKHGRRRGRDPGPQATVIRLAAAEAPSPPAAGAAISRSAEAVRRVA